MKLYEYESKNLLKQSNIPIPISWDLPREGQVSPKNPYVLKSQVLTGGRGKAGGIIIAESQEKVGVAINKLFALPIKGLKPVGILIEEKLDIEKEFYLSILIDRTAASVKILAHINGGVEVEDNHDFKEWFVDYGFLNADVIGQELADYYELPGQTFALQDLIKNLYDCFTQNDATLIEINPLVLTSDEKLVAGDCKMTLDDAAAFRHEWHFKEKPAESNFVTINQDGNVATIANGAGLAMATVDAAFKAGLTPANFLDIGGGANEETLLKAFNRIVEYPNIQAIIINIFAGITRADEVAKAVVSAKEQIENLPPLFIRLAGTNYEAAEKILSEHSITLLPDLESALSAAQESINA